MDALREGGPLICGRVSMHRHVALDTHYLKLRVRARTVTDFFAHGNTRAAICPHTRCVARRIATTDQNLYGGS